jgi:hypothetical protein
VALPYNFGSTICLVAENVSPLMCKAAGSTSRGAFPRLPVRGLALAKPVVEATPFVLFDMLFPVESQ